MIAHVAGALDYIKDNQIIIDVSGIGYGILVSDSVIKQIPSVGGFLKVFTHQHVREDELSLFGFSTVEEKEIFLTLIGVSGIGGKTALAIISAIDRDKLVNAIMTNDLVTLTSLPGIGKKTAERLVVELKDKLSLFSVTISPVTVTTENTRDAMEALKQLGYNVREVSKALANIESEISTEANTEEIIKKALRFL